MKELGYDPNIRRFRFKLTDEIVIAERPKEFFSYYIHDYYSKRKFKMDVDADVQTVRRLIYDFKDGRNSNAIASLIKDAVQAINFSLDNTCLVTIPASTQQKTEVRYRIFSDVLCGSLGILNSINGITTEPHDENKGKYGGDKTKYFTFSNKYYLNKRVILLDDVRTTGASYVQVLKKLMNTGAIDITGIFLGKTFDEWA